MDDADRATMRELSLDHLRKPGPPTGLAPCRCAIVENDDGQHVTQCELADIEGRGRPAGCTRGRGDWPAG